MSAKIEEGQAIEKFVADILSKSKLITDVKCSEYNDKGDIYYRMTADGILRTLQVKKMGKSSAHPSHSDYQYSINSINKYPDDMLIIALNIEDKLCAIFTGAEGRGKSASASINYGPRCRKGKFNKYKIDWNMMEQVLIDRCSSSTKVNKIEDMITKCFQLEKAMTDRFAQFCAQSGYKFEKDNTMSVSDCRVNGKKVQLKFASNPIGTNGTYSYKFSLHKGTRNLIDGIRTTKPYQKGDNDYYVFEIGGYEGRFLILSENYLIQRDRISVNGGHAIKTFGVYPPGYTKLAKRERQQRGNWTYDEDLWWTADQERFIIW